MAKAAKGGNVAADMKPTDYRGAFNRLKQIDSKKSKQQGIAKEIGDIYAACEAICGVDKTAAKIFMALRKLDDNDRLTAFRDLNGLLDASGLVSAGADLVDKAQNNVVPMRLPIVEDEESNIETELDELADDGSVVDDDDFTEASEDELAQQAGRAETDAKRRAKEAMGKGDPEPYTGDNSDLADAAE